MQPASMTAKSDWVLFTNRDPGCAGSEHAVPLLLGERHESHGLDPRTLGEEREGPGVDRRIDSHEREGAASRRLASEVHGGDVDAPRAEHGPDLADHARDVAVR